MRIIGLYVNGQRHVLDDSAAILSRANQALATLERYKLRLDEVCGTLSALEIEDLVTVRDAVAVVQRLEMVRRIADEIAGLRGRARHRRPAARAAARRADGRRRRPTAPWSSATTCRPAGAAAHARGGAGRAGPALRHRADRPGRGGQGARLPGRVRRARRRGRRRAGSGCWPRCRGCPARSWTGWSITSAACSGCSAPPSRTCRRSTASATPGPAASGRACPAWPRRHPRALRLKPPRPGREARLKRAGMESARRGQRARPATGALTLVSRRADQVVLAVAGADLRPAGRRHVARWPCRSRSPVRRRSSSTCLQVARVGLRVRRCRSRPTTRSCGHPARCRAPGVGADVTRARPRRDVLDLELRISAWYAARRHRRHRRRGDQPLTAAASASVQSGPRPAPSAPAGV